MVTSGSDDTLCDELRKRIKRDENELILTQDTIAYINSMLTGCVVEDQDVVKLTDTLKSLNNHADMLKASIVYVKTVVDNLC